MSIALYSAPNRCHTNNAPSKASGPGARGCAFTKRYLCHRYFQAEEKYSMHSTCTANRSGTAYAAAHTSIVEQFTQYHIVNLHYTLSWMPHKTCCCMLLHAAVVVTCCTAPKQAHGACCNACCLDDLLCAICHVADVRINMFCTTNCLHT